jgi:MFS family permease
VRLLPSTATRDAGVLVATRGVRAFVDGLVAVVLPSYLVLLGFSGARQGAIVTAMLVGSAVVTLAVGLRGHRLRRLRLLQTVAVVMILTGVGFGLFSSFWALMVVAVVGTLNPSSGDVSVFLPTEQALLPSTVPDVDRTAMFARYTVVGYVGAAVGSLAASVPDLVTDHTSVSRQTALRAVFFTYALAGVVVLCCYRMLSSRIETPAGEHRSALGPSRRIVYRLAAVFSLDSLGGGFVVQALLALWLFRRFDLSVATTGVVFFWSGLLSGGSALVAARLARRIGLVRTMVFTHLPANALLIATAFMPNVWLAVGCLLARSALSQMDVPARQSYVMAVVTAPERAAAASVTNVPRSLASAAAPVAAGWLLDQSTFGWPLLIGGALKIVYDLVLLVMFGHIRPPEEQDGLRPHPRATDAADS